MLHVQQQVPKKGAYTYMLDSSTLALNIVYYYSPRTVYRGLYWHPMYKTCTVHLHIVDISKEVAYLPYPHQDTMENGRPTDCPRCHAEKISTGGYQCHLCTTSTTV